MNGQELLRIFRKDAIGWGRERWQKLAESEKPRHAEAGRLMTAWIDFFETKAGTVRDSAARLNVLLNRCMNTSSGDAAATSSTSQNCTLLSAVGNDLGIRTQKRPGCRKNMASS